MFRAALCVLLGALAGCFDAGAQVCSGSDGVAVLCPSDTTCMPVGTTVACLHESATCGDGVVGGDEVCDDGNTVSGDGCSADCRSNETCGNRIVDSVRGEQCDDGNTLAHDGCDSSCAPELPHWIDLLPGTPSARDYVAMAYDAHHDNIVMFGGGHTVVGTVQDTWLWHDGWHQAQPLSSPVPRSHHVMAGTGVAGSVYLFGGADAVGNPLGDLWRWTGADWQHVVTRGPEPGPRFDAALAYDAHRRVLVLFGGTTASGDTDETWELDTTRQPEQWQRIDALMVPTARAQHAMAYDAAHQQMVMYGGSNGEQDTWTYDDEEWTLSSAASPVATSPIFVAGQMAFDGTQIVMTPAAPPSSNDPDPPFVWDGSAWQVTTDSRHARSGAAIAFEPPGNLLLFGGINPAPPIKPGSTPGPLQSHETDRWSAGMATWSFVSGNVFSRSGEAGVLDLGRGYPIVFGGVNDSVLADLPAYVLALIDGVWLPLAPGGTTAPAPAIGVAAAYDEAHLETLFFGGGSGSSGVLSDETWALTGTSTADLAWSQLQPPAAPAARRDHAMAYDAKRQRVILFGGTGSDGSVLADTWDWDGSAATWTAEQSAASPPARTGPGLAYDRVHHVVVLFGGFRAGGAPLGDTWLLDASGWQATQPTRSPTARGGVAMAWDPARQRVVLFGGETTTAEQDTWEWDGTTWAAVQVVEPPPRVGGVLMGTSDGLVLYGGAPRFGATSPLLADVWLLRYDGSHPPESCRDDSDADGDGQHGCADGDCWLACRPLCLPGDPCDPLPAGPSCGDGVCSANETAELCPTDGCALPICGDATCEGSADCPGDCP